MKTIKINLYKYDELSKEAKHDALLKLSDINTDHEWWESTYEDAEAIGCKITGFDTGRNDSIGFEMTTGLEDCYDLIKKNHGKETDTYKLAIEVESKHDTLLADCSISDHDLKECLNELDAYFTQQLAEEYLSMLRKQLEYLESEEAIIETIEANDYDFTDEGVLYE